MTAQLLAVALDPAAVTLTPGRQATVEVAIRNTTGRVGDFRVGLVNPRNVPVTADAKEINLKVGDTATVALTLTMPPDARPIAGEHFAGIQVTSTSVALSGATEELRVMVPRWGDAVMRVEPEVSGRGRFAITIASQASAPLRLALAGRDAEGHARFAFENTTLGVAPYAQATTNVRVRASRPLTGPEKRRQLTFEAMGGPTPLVANATLVCRRWIPAALIKTAIVLLVLIAAWGLAGWLVNFTPLDLFPNQPPDTAPRRPEPTPATAAQKQ